MDTLVNKYKSVKIEKTEQVDVLFVVTCFYDWFESNTFQPIHEEAYSVVSELLSKTPIFSGNYGFIPALPYADINEEELDDTEVRNHREFVESLIIEANPKLIIPLGNAACLSVLKKSGIFNKRGKEFYVEVGDKTISVIPSYHPNAVYLEPTLRKVFVEDLTNAYNKVILGLNKFKKHNYILCKNMDEVREQFALAMKSKKVAVDTETEGLDFKKDKMTCFGASYAPKSAFVVPFHHAESPFSDSELGEISQLIQELMAAKDIMKIFANSKFDIKILMNHSIIEFENLHDIQFMHSLVDENRKHALSDITKQYFPLEIQDF